jgi:hypothetical protein
MGQAATVGVVARKGCIAADESPPTGKHAFASARSLHVVRERRRQFTRSFSLPDAANAETLRADPRDGHFTIELQKQPEVQAKEIAVGRDERGVKS